jgi:hypothetical protein
MRWLCGELSCDVRSLLEEERLVAALPASTRARAIARAREALAAGTAALLSPPGLSRLLPSLTVVGLFGLVSALCGVGAFVLSTHLSSSSVVAAAPPVERPAADDSRSAASPSADAPIVESSPSEQAHPTAEDGREELRLLELARAKLANDDFAAALSPLAEHARRFRQGRLAEEREALRLRALSGLGRREEVRRGAAAFEARFPRSPLVPVIQQMAASEP